MQGWEGRKQRREARADGSGASAPGSGVSVGSWPSARVGGEHRGRGLASAPESGASARPSWARRCDGGEWGFLGGGRRDEAGRVRILG